MNAQQQWHRNLVMVALHRAGAPQRADGALLERVVGLALDAGAETAEVAAITPQKLYAALRGLVASGRAVQGPMVRDARQGREVQTFLPGSDYLEPDLKPPRVDDEALAVVGLREGRRLAKRLAHGAPRDRVQRKMDALFKDLAHDQATVLVKIEATIEAFKKKYRERYQKALEELEA